MHILATICFGLLKLFDQTKFMERIYMKEQMPNSKMKKWTKTENHHCNSWTHS